MKLLTIKQQKPYENAQICYIFQKMKANMCKKKDITK